MFENAEGVDEVFANDGNCHEEAATGVKKSDVSSRNPRDELWRIPPEINGICNNQPLQVNDDPDELRNGNGSQPHSEGEQKDASGGHDEDNNAAEGTGCM